MGKVGGNPRSAAAHHPGLRQEQAPSGSGHRGWRQGRGRRERREEAARSVPVRRRGHRSELSGWMFRLPRLGILASGTFSNIFNSLDNSSEALDLILSFLSVNKLSLFFSKAR